MGDRRADYSVAARVLLVYHFILAGIASWFHPSEFSPALHVSTPYVCAMWPRSMTGKHLEIENADNGRISHCIVTGTGPNVPGRILDVSPKVAGELGMLRAGLAHVRVYRIGSYNFCHRRAQPQTCAEASKCILGLPPSVKECP